MAKSIYFPNLASSDRIGDLVIYDSAFDETRNLAQILAHEIAHRIFESLSDEDIESYRFPAGWINVSTLENPILVLTRKSAVKENSYNNIEEDFANNIEFYLFNRAKLQEISPGAYNWIKNHFGAKFKSGKGVS